MKRSTFNILLIVLICITIPMITLAQGPPDPNDVPVDGGLSLLIAAGAAYGVKKYRDNKRKGEERQADVK
jgi:hypothetical protein